MTEPTAAKCKPSTDNSQRTTHRGQTGPKTPEGKKKSSMNALKHGMRASAPYTMEVVEGLWEINFEPYLECMRDYFQPNDPIEHKLVERIARCFWRLDRAADMDRRGYVNSMGSTRPGDSNHSILRYERMVDLQLGRALKALSGMRGPSRNVTQYNPHRQPEGEAPPSVDWERRMLAGRKK